MTAGRTRLWPATGVCTRRVDDLFSHMDRSGREAEGTDLEGLGTSFHKVRLEK